MSAALWGFLGVLVGAAVALITTWLQMRSERAVVRREADIAALLSLQDAMLEWLQCAGLVGVDRDPEAGQAVRVPSDSVRSGTLQLLFLRLDALKERVRDDEIRDGARMFLFHAASVGEPDVNPEDIITQYHESKNLIGKRLRGLR